MDTPKFLIVDDSNAALYALERILAPVGAKIHVAHDAAEGQRIVENTPLDLIITDVDMPGRSGLEFCDWIKRNPGTADTPVIILSSRETDRDIDRGFEVGADAYVPKSAAGSDMVPRIEQVLDRVALARDRLILLIDDSKAVRSIMGDGLRRAGFKVEAAQNGEEALEVLDSVVPDLILMDLIMPGINGLELCREIQSREALASVPIVVMSRVSDKVVMRRMIQDGISAYVTKPIGINNLVQVLKRILSEQFHLMRVEQKRLAAERNLTLGSITSLVRALEARDKYTCGHSESVTGIAMGVARHLGFSNNDMARLHIAGLLHDLGKIGVRDNVLLKPGKLTDAEYEHIKEHTTVVADILAPLPGMKDVLLAASSHHERWDGSGYPKGLKGEEIPFIGRIIAVADVYDAMTSDRVYRKALSGETAVKTITEGRGVLFCPECVDAFLKWHKEFSGVRPKAGLNGRPE
ncbi:MAG: response regulator [Desulfovibrionaceae bacterium]|nr:response regulator [Desulfovibrionaceae bacterium]